MLPFPANLLLIPIALATCVAYIRAERLRARPGRRAVRVGLLAALWAAPLTTSGPGPVQLALGLVVVLLGIRAVGLAEQGRRESFVPTRTILRELVMPRALLVERATPVRRPGWVTARGLAGIAACVVLLVVGNHVRLWRWSRYADGLLVFVEVAVGSAGIHDTLVGIAAAGFQRSIRGLLDRPALSISLAEFWGRRWNRLVQNDLDRAFFRPLARRGAWAAGTLAAFVASGVLHAVPLLAADAWQVTWRAALGVMGFFLIHGGLVLLEQAWARGRKAARDDDQTASVRRFGRRLRTMLIFAALSPLLLGPFAAAVHVHGRSLRPAPAERGL